MIAVILNHVNKEGPTNSYVNLIKLKEKRTSSTEDTGVDLGDREGKDV